MDDLNHKSLRNLFVVPLAINRAGENLKSFIIGSDGFFGKREISKNFVRSALKIFFVRTDINQKTKKNLTTTLYKFRKTSDLKKNVRI